VGLGRPLRGLWHPLATAPEGVSILAQFSVPLPTQAQGPCSLPRIPPRGDGFVSAWEKTLDCAQLHLPLPVGVAAELGAFWAGSAMHKVVALASSLLTVAIGWLEAFSGVECVSVAAALVLPGVRFTDW